MTRSRRSRDAIRLPTQPYLHALTGLRFVAVMSIVLYHYGGSYLSGAPWWVTSIIGRGNVWVSLFFILSGFVLHYAYVGPRRPKDDTAPSAQTPKFYLARLARLYPVYLISFALALPLYLANLLIFKSAPTSPSDVIAVLVGNLLLLQAWLHPQWIPDDPNVLNPASWALSVEVFFYVIFPWIGSRLAKLRAAYAVLLAIGVYLAIPASALLGLSVALPYLPILHLPEFVLGLLVGRLFLAFRDGGNRWVTTGAAGASLVAIAAVPAVILLSSNPKWDTALVVPIFSLLVLALAHGSGWLARALSLPIMRSLGDASYAIFILHMPLMAWMVWLTAIPSSRVFSRLTGIRAGESFHQSWVFLAVYIVVVIAVSVLVLFRVEKPARRRLAYSRPVDRDSEADVPPRRQAQPLGEAGGRLEAIRRTAAADGEGG